MSAAIKLIPYATLGSANFGWLQARYHFSFARYWNPERMGFGALRVINDDIVSPHNGFDTHKHDNMEIITYVRSGAITHEDSMGNKGVTAAGDVQVMSAGSGIAHSEHNFENEDTTLYQIWIMPNEKNVKPRWEAKTFPKEYVSTALPLLASGMEEHKDTGALFIHQDAAVYGGRLAKGTSLNHAIKHQAYVLASYGQFSLNGTVLSKGDGAEITGLEAVSLHALEDSELLVIDVPR